jgi:hypothetical protein
MSKTLISVGELIDQSWELYRSRFIEFLTISGWLILTAIFFALALAFYPAASVLQSGEPLTGWETFGVILFSITTYVITPLISFWIYTSVTRMIGAYMNGKKITPAAAMREGRAVFLKALLTSVMVVLMVLFAIVIGFGPPVLVATIGSLANLSSLILVANVLLVIGIFAALILSIQWTVYYLLAPLLTILDGLPAKSALEYSRRLIKGRFWPVLARVVVPKLVFIIFGVFAMSLFAFVANFAIDASSGISTDVQVRFVSMVETIIPIIITVLINPLIIISDVLLLRSLRD